MVTGFPGHNKRVSRETRTPGPLEAPPMCKACGKPANAPKGVHRVLVFGVGWFHVKCRRTWKGE